LGAIDAFDLTLGLLPQSKSIKIRLEEIHVLVTWQAVTSNVIIPIPCADADAESIVQRFPFLDT
jgi:hypothetical protein